MTESVGPQDLVSKSKFAALAGVSRQAINKLTREGGSLSASVVDGRVNVNEANAKSYLLKRRRPEPADPPPSVGGRPPQDRDSMFSDMVAQSSVNLDGVLDMTMRDIIKIFATDVRFKDWMAGLKNLAAVRKQELELEQKAGKLVDRELVATGVFEPLDSAFRRMLADVPQTVATQAVARVGAGAGVKEIEVLVRDQLESQIAPAKAKVVRTLERAAKEGKTQ